MPDEYLDLVNPNDEVVGKKPRGEVYAEGLSNFRVVNAFVKNSKGQLWIPLRTATKRIFPLCLDMSMGGHVESGETYEVSFKRELIEELAINADVVPWKLLGALTPQQHGVAAFMHVYEISADEVPRFNPNDFSEFYWLYPDQLLEKIAGGQKAKDDLPKLINIFYSK